MIARRGAVGVLALVLVALLAGCTGLPTTGPVNAGLSLAEDGELADPTPIAQGPGVGAGPEEIVAGFLEAAVTPAGNWEIAREFLTPDFAHAWKPDAGVTIDDSTASRKYQSDAGSDDESATETVVRVEFKQVASLDENGAYSEESNSAAATYKLVRAAGGEWRIAEAADGIVLDADSLDQVFRKYDLQYFDQSWTHLVPDVRWFARRPSVATSITRAVISGEPSEWLAPAVRTAFAGDVALAGDSVPVDSSQVAEVSLNRAALSASPSALARMRTQLEASLAGLGVTAVRFAVDGTVLEADRVVLEQPGADPGILVLKDQGFGISAGDEVTPVPALTAEIGKVSEPIAAIDVAVDNSLAAVQMAGGSVFAVADGTSAQIDGRPGLIAPSVDPFGFIWTVPRDAPHSVRAHRRDTERHDVAQAWSDATAISQLRVSSDGARVAAVVSSGSQRRIVVAAVIRDEDDVPVQLGPAVEVTRLEQAAQGLAWVGDDTLAVLADARDPVLILHVVGGPAQFSGAPAGAKSLSGGRNPAAVRVLSSDGAVYAQRGSSWQQSTRDVLVLGTRAGF